MPGCQERRTIRSAGSAAVSIAPEFVLPIDDIPAGVESCAQAQGHRRAAGSPHKFVVSHPLHLYRAAARRSGEQGGVKRGIVGAVVPVATRSFDMPHDDCVLAHPQSQREVAAQIENSLGVAP